MSEPVKRVFEVRLLVIATVDIHDDELTEALARLPQPSSLADVVGQEIVSNLESVSYVNVVIVSQL